MCASGAGALPVAPPQEVRKRGALARYRVIDNRGRHEGPPAVGRARADANAEVGVLRPRRGADLAEPTSKPSDRLECACADRHVLAPDVAYRRQLRWQSRVRRPHHPAEFVRKPARTLALPGRLGRPSRADHTRILQRGHQLAQPAWMRADVIVQENQIRIAGPRRARIARGRRAAVAAVINNLDALDLQVQPGEQGLVVVDRDDHLVKRGHLPARRFDRF